MGKDRIVANDRDHGDRTRAARAQEMLALGERPDGVPVLCRHLIGEDDPVVREAILAGLIRNPQPRVVEALLPILASEDAALRTGVLAVLRTMPDAVETHVVPMLADADPEIRCLTVSRLAMLPHPLVRRWLLGVLHDDPHPLVCAIALDGIAQIGGPDAVIAIAAVRSRFSDDRTISFAADIARRVLAGH